MGGRRARYEFRSVRVRRGGANRAAAKWQSQGWELVDREERGIRPRLTFGRARPPVRTARRVAVLSGSVVVLVVLAASGVVLDVPARMGAAVSQITGDGTYSIGGTSTSSDGAEYDARETAATAPQLVVTTGIDPPPADDPDDPAAVADAAETGDGW